MNEHIKALAIQAGISIPQDTEYNGSVHTKALEAFAIAIVKECAEVAYNASWESILSLPEWNDAKNIVCSETHYAIEKHFGIEDE